MPLQAETHVEEEDILNFDKADVERRKRRSYLGFFIGKIATIVIEALGSYLQKKKQKVKGKIVNELQSKRFLIKNKLYKLGKDFLI